VLPSWLNWILKATSAVMEEVPKTADSHMTRFPKAAANSHKKSTKIVQPSDFRKPVHVATVLVAFINPFMTALAVFEVINRIS
jgi:cellobiose-specific phosphotransferase system component IIA